MPSISHRASLGQGSPHRARFGPTALPAGIVHAVIRWCRAWLDVGRDLHQLEEHVVHDVGFQLRSGRRSGPYDAKQFAADLPPETDGPPKSDSNSEGRLTWPTTS
jgi:hypothetical protein